MTKNRLFLTIMTAWLAANAWAQDCTESEGKYRMADATQLWRLTDNAAGLGIDSTENRGFALFNAEHWDGTFTRVQQGSQNNQLRFQTERYQKVGKYLHGYGKFDFDYGRLKNRAWCDVMRPYNANPYFAGSSIKGKYDFQDFDFTAGLGTIDLNGWRVGMKLRYKVGDFSRLRDPRSRSQLLDYQVIPGVTYTTGAHTFGLNASYQRRKEKIIGVTTVQQDASLKYYLMTGMEHATGTVGGYSSFNREWVDHRFGGELTYALHTNRQHTLLSLTAERGEEYAYGQYKYEPGKYVDYRYALGLHNRIFGNRIMHQTDVKVAYDQAYADEYRMQLEQTKDPETGFTSFRYLRQLTFKKRYQVKVLDADIHYRLSFLTSEAQKKNVSGYVGAAFSLNDTSNKHLLPVSELCYGGSNILLEGGKALVNGRFWIDASAGYHHSNKADLTLDTTTQGQTDVNEYAASVLIPDMEYYKANYWRTHLQLTWLFNLKLKGKPSTWFVRAYGDYLKTDNKLDANCIGISVGLFN